MNCASASSASCSRLRCRACSSAERAELALHRLDPAVERRAVGRPRARPAGPSCHAGSAAGRSGWTRRRSGYRRREARLAHVQNEQHVALPHRWPSRACASTTVAACGATRRMTPRSGTRKPVTRALRVYSPGPEKAADSDHDAQNETRQQPTGNGTGQLDGAEPAWRWFRSTSRRNRLCTSSDRRRTAQELDALTPDLGMRDRIAPNYQYRRSAMRRNRSRPAPETLGRLLPESGRRRGHAGTGRGCCRAGEISACMLDSGVDFVTRAHVRAPMHSAGRRAE